MKLLALLFVVVVAGCKKEEAKPADKAADTKVDPTGLQRDRPSVPGGSDEPVDEAKAKAALEDEQTRAAVRTQVESILKEEQAILDEITNVVGELTSAKSEAERVAAQKKMDELSKQKLEIVKRLAAAKANLPAAPPAQQQP